MDPSGLSADAEVFIVGSLPELGNWNPHRGYPLHRDAENPAMWASTVELPIGMAEKCNHGLFEYKYVVNGGSSGFIWEGHGTDSTDKRKVTDMEPVFYGGFKKKFGRGGGVDLSVKDPELIFIREELRKLQRNQLDPAGFLTVFDSITDSIPSSRACCEGIFDDLVLEGGVIQTPILLCHLAMVGAYKLSSSETYGHGAYARKQDPKDPSHWTWAALEGSDVRELLGVYNLKYMQDTFGEHHNWVFIGMQEAIQRAQYSGSYQWLRVHPWMATADKLPVNMHENCYKEAESLKRDDEFRKAALHPPQT